MGSVGQQYAEMSTSFDQRFQPSWPVNEVVLSAALNSGMTPDQIAKEFGVSADDVVLLSEEYGLEHGLAG